MDTAHKELTIATACATLARLGCTKVECRHSGSGDSGQVDAMHFYNAEGEDMRIIDPTLEDFLGDQLWEVAMRDHEGYYNNEGGSGSVTLDTATGTAVVDQAYMEPVDAPSTVHELLRTE